MTRHLLGLITVFTPLSIATVGGGQAIVADVQRQVVDVHHWMTQTQFINAFAISRMAPGPGSLLVTLIGWQVGGVVGAIVATVAIFGPTALLIYGVARLWNRQSDARWQKALEGGLRPVAAGLILAAVYVLLRSLDGGWMARGITLISTALLMTTRINPLLPIAMGAIMFVGIQSLLGG
jgi:chromate transporter